MIKAPIPKVRVIIRKKLFIFDETKAALNAEETYHMSMTMQLSREGQH